MNYFILFNIFQWIMVKYTIHYALGMEELTINEEVGESQTCEEKELMLPDFQHVIHLCLSFLKHSRINFLFGHVLESYNILLDDCQWFFNNTLIAYQVLYCVESVFGVDYFGFSFAFSNWHEHDLRIHIYKCSQWTDTPYPIQIIKWCRGVQKRLFIFYWVWFKINRYVLGVQLLSFLFPFI